MVSGMANVDNFTGRLDVEPTLITECLAGAGITELAKIQMDGS